MQGINWSQEPLRSAPSRSSSHEVREWASQRAGRQESRPQQTALACLGAKGGETSRKRCLAACPAWHRGDEHAMASSTSGLPKSHVVRQAHGPPGATQAKVERRHEGTPQPTILACCQKKSQAPSHGKGKRAKALRFCL